MINPTELLDSLNKELYNKGKWRWTDENGSKARLLTAIQKMLKSGMSEDDIKTIIIELESVFYVEHEKQVKDKTGLSVREFMEKKLKDLGPPPASVLDNEHEPECASV